MNCDIDDAIKTLQAVKATQRPSTRKIVVLDRGWVAIGLLGDADKGKILFDAAIIRVWGTTKGLPELQQGPTSKTKLDPCSLPICFTEASVIFTLDVNDERWDDAY